MLVVDLDKIIKGAGKQKTSTIHLNIFPNEANEISSIFMEFTDNMHKQMWLIGKDIPTFESLEAKGAEITSLTFNASGMGVTWDEMPKFLSTRGFYLYVKVKGLDVDVPIDKVTKVIVSKPVYGEIRVKEQCFFPSYQVVYENGEPLIRIGKGISVDIRSEDNRITVHIDRPDTLSDFIIEAEFFLEMVEQGEFTLNGVTFPLNGMELHDHGIFVSVVNPLVIHGYCSGGTVRKVKNDRKDSLKIAKFALDHWVDLREYTPMDAARQQLKIFSRQYNLYMKSRVALQSNLIRTSISSWRSPPRQGICWIKPGMNSACRWAAPQRWK